jgi:hypothetical protein
MTPYIYTDQQSECTYNNDKGRKDSMSSADMRLMTLIYKSQNWANKKPWTY